jgi:hypothetical protein
MIDKKMKGDWTALPIGVSATAAVGQAQARGDEKKKTVVDITQYPNLGMNLENVQAAENKYAALLQQVGDSEKAAATMLALGADCPSDERSRAEGLLLKCAEDRANLEEALGRVRRQIEGLKAQMAPMEAEVERQQKIRSVAAGLR